MNNYTFSGVINSDRLQQEIKDSPDILIALWGISTVGESITISFKAPLSQGEQDSLASLVGSHTPTPLQDAVQTIPVIINETPVYATGEIENSYFKETFTIETSAGVGPYLKSISWPYPIAILGGKVVTKEAWEGDSFSVTIGPNSLVGSLISPVLSGAKLLSVDAVCAEFYVWKGDVITLTDGAQLSISLGRLISKEGNVITMENPVPYNLPSGLGVLVTTVVSPYYEVSGAEEVLIGRKTHRASYIPPNVPLVISYLNTSSTVKKVRFALEWYA